MLNSLSVRYSVTTPSSPFLAALMKRATTTLCSSMAGVICCWCVGWCLFSLERQPTFSLVEVHGQSCVPASLRACAPASLRPCVPASLRPCVPASLRTSVPLIPILYSNNNNNQQMFAVNWFWSILYKIGLLQKKASIILVGMNQNKSKECNKKEKRRVIKEEEGKE